MIPLLWRDGDAETVSEVIVGDIARNYSSGFWHSLHLPSQPEKISYPMFLGLKLSVFLTSKP